MANEIPNAVALMGDGPFRDWVKAAIVYQARLVIIEADTVTDHAARLRLANIVATNPSAHLDTFVNAIACDPTVCSIGTTVGTAAGTITQSVLLAKVDGVWGPIAKMLYPNPVI